MLNSTNRDNQGHFTARLLSPDVNETVRFVENRTVDASMSPAKLGARERRENARERRRMII